MGRKGWERKEGEKEEEKEKRKRGKGAVRVWMLVKFGNAHRVLTAIVIIYVRRMLSIFGRF